MISAYQQSLGGMGEVRVRMAPSPTGFLHIGTARTALFNWLFARKYNGVFVMRIEDTDPERSQKIYEKDIVEGLKLLGIDWDEGPDVGGPYGPYRQSERADIYRRYLEQLIDEEKAYHCFCSQEELMAAHQDMEARGEIYRYSGKCRGLGPEQVKENMDQGKPFAVRLKVGNEKVAFEDVIRGTIETSTDQLGDIAISRGLDGALYNYSVVIDDHEMKISHVIRGEDHIPNTPKQILVQRAFGWEQPIYAHLPLILGTDRTKLSKRHGATSLKDYIGQGYLPEALLNFLSLLGWHPSGDREVFLTQELISEFSLDRVQKGGAIFNIVKLNWFNNYYLRKKSAADLRETAVAFLVQDGFLEPAGENGYRYPQTGTIATPAYLESVFALAVERLNTLGELKDAIRYFFEDPSCEASMIPWKQMTRDETRGILKRIKEVFDKVSPDEFGKEKITVALEELYQGDKGHVLWPLRVVLSGKEASPPPFDIAAIVGKDTVMRRIDNAIQTLL